jgi:hypothetical protein
MGPGTSIRSRLDVSVAEEALTALMDLLGTGMVRTGVLVGLAGLWLLPPEVGPGLFGGLVAPAARVPVGISSVVWRRDPPRETFTA